MTDIYLDESDTKRLIKEKLLRNNISNLLKAVNNPISCPNHCSNEIELQQAIDYLSSTLETVEEKDTQIMLQLSSLLYQSGSLEAAYDYYSKIIEIEPDNVKAWVGRAKISFAWSSYQDAIEDINTAISLSPSAKETCSEIEEHYKDLINDNTMLEVEPNEQLRELLQFRDRILQRMHTSMTGMYS